MTIDKTRLPRPAGPKAPLPSFTPVPRLTTRHDGWTAARQQNFIEALADTGSVKAAAHRVNMTPEGAYLLRRHPQGATFRKAWEAALALGVQQLEDIAMERALYGCEVPVYSYGKLIGSRIVYNDRLLMFMLRNRAPERFTAGKPAGPGAIDQMQITRLKRQWRQEWEDERARDEAADPEATTAALDAMIDGMQRNWLDGLTRGTRALYEAYVSAAEHDEAAGRHGWNDPDHGDAPDEDDDGLSGANVTHRIELSDFREDRSEDQ